MPIDKGAKDKERFSTRILVKVYHRLDTSRLF